MVIEELFRNNYIVLYLISILFLLINNDSMSQKMVIIYLFTYLIKIYNILDVKILIPILLIGLFIYFEFLIVDNIKQKSMENFWHKCLDYTYQLLFIYNVFPYLVSLLLISHFFIDKVGDFCILFYLFSIILLIYSLTKNYSNNYNINSFEIIYKKMADILKTKAHRNGVKFKKYYNLVTIFEDKTYFERKNDYNLICIEFIKGRYKIKKNILNTDFLVILRYLKEFIIDFKKIFKKPYRGYSTIEMQVIRTLGLKPGSFNHIYKRKVYELIYSHIFFKSINQYLKKSNLPYKNFKEDIVYIYYDIAPVFFKGKRYKNIMDMWSKQSLDKCTIEEIYIGVLCLSNKLNNVNNAFLYDRVINEFGINTKKLKNRINTLISKNKK